MNSAQNSYLIIYQFWNAKPHSFCIYSSHRHRWQRGSRINFSNNPVGAGPLPSDKNDFPFKKSTESKFHSREPFIHDLLSTMPLGTEQKSIRTFFFEKNEWREGGNYRRREGLSIVDVYWLPWGVCCIYGWFPGLSKQLR